MYEACESTSHECTFKIWSKKYNEDIVVEKEELFMKKDMENKETMSEKKYENKQSAV